MQSVVHDAYRSAVHNFSRPCAGACHKEDYHNAVNYRPELEPKFYSDISSFIVTLYTLNYNVPIEKVPVGPEEVAVWREQHVN